MLSEHTDDKKYANIAAEAYQVLPPRGQQHTHGYLTTLRGVLDLYEYTEDSQHLRYVQQAYDALVNSDDYTAFGAVPEYFGGKGERDEGCSTADFMRLSFQLHRLTNEQKYLDRGEFALYNAFYFNQYFTGDFGSHFITRRRCSTGGTHGLVVVLHDARSTAMHHVKEDTMWHTSSDRKQVNLYLETDLRRRRYRVHFVSERKGRKSVPLSSRNY